jgi:hypothetical protein
VRVGWCVLHNATIAAATQAPCYMSRPSTTNLHVCAVPAPPPTHTHHDPAAPPLRPASPPVQPLPSYTPCRFLAKKGLKSL